MPEKVPEFVMLPLMLTCKEAHRLVSEDLDRDLPLGERLRVRMHLLACTSCSRFRDQMQFLRKAMRSLGE
jgi:hypothetical protein